MIEKVKDRIESSFIIRKSVSETYSTQASYIQGDKACESTEISLSEDDKQNNLSEPDMSRQKTESADSVVEHVLSDVLREIKDELALVSEVNVLCEVTSEPTTTSETPSTPGSSEVIKEVLWKLMKQIKDGSKLTNETESAPIHNQSCQMSSGSQEFTLRGSGSQEFTLRGSGSQESTLRGSGSQESTLRGSGSQESTLRGSRSQESTLRGSGSQESTLRGSRSQESTLRGSRSQESTLRGQKSSNWPESSFNKESVSSEDVMEMISKMITEIRDEITIASLEKRVSERVKHLNSSLDRDSGSDVSAEVTEILGAVMTEVGKSMSFVLERPVSSSSTKFYTTR